jgi:ABC-type Fe3+ transport system permease subunit
MILQFDIIFFIASREALEQQKQQQQQQQQHQQNRNWWSRILVCTAIAALVFVNVLLVMLAKKDGLELVQQVEELFKENDALTQANRAHVNHTARTVFMTLPSRLQQKHT